MRTHLLWIGVMTASSLWLSGCTQEEKYPFFPEKSYDSGTVIPIKISMAENGEYDSYTPENDMPPRYNAPLIAEWAGVQTLSRTRTKESPEYNGPRIASMELTENTPSTLTTRCKHSVYRCLLSSDRVPKVREQLCVPIGCRLYLKWCFFTCTEERKITHTLRNDPGHRILIQYNCGIGGYPRIIYI